MRKKLMLAMIFALIAGPLVGYAEDAPAADTNQPIKSAQKPLYWVDTMEPDVHYSAPGKSRMGMELVPVYTDQKKNLNGNTTPSKE